MPIYKYKYPKTQQRVPKKANVWDLKRCDIDGAVIYILSCQ